MSNSSDVTFAAAAERGYDPARLVEPNGLVHLDMIWFDRAI